MKTLEEMRDKHWFYYRGSLIPQKQSHKELDVGYKFVGLVKLKLKKANDLFNQALLMGDCEESRKLLNNANYYLTGAYAGGESNKEFWSQFL